MKRLSPAFLTMTMLGVVGLLVTMYFAKHMLATEEVVVEDPVLDIPMALTDLSPGTMITEAHLGLGRALESSISRNTVIRDRVLIGRIVKEAIPAAEPINSTWLYPPNEGPPLDIEPGKRAVTVTVGASSNSMVQLIKPGQYVDVHFTPTELPEFDRSGGLIMTLLKGVKILALNGVQTGSVQAGRDGANVTLELSPAQANVVLLAKDRGELNLTYTPEGKGNQDIAVTDENRATLEQILGLSAPPEDIPVPAEKETAFVTETFSGTSRGMHSFVDGRRADQFVVEQQDYNAYRNATDPNVEPTGASTAEN